MPRTRAWIAAAATAVVLAGCVPLNVLQTPHPVPDGAEEWTLAAGYVTDPDSEVLFEGSDEFLGPLPTVAVRFGQGDGFDWGVRAGFPEGVSFDVKKQFVDGSPALSGYLGLATLFAHAGLIAGSERAYVGGRAFGGRFEDDSDPEGGWGLFGGGVFGHDPRWTLEVGSLSFGGGDGLIIISLAATWRRQR